MVVILVLMVTMVVVKALLTAALLVNRDAKIGNGVLIGDKYDGKMIIVVTLRITTLPGVMILKQSDVWFAIST